MHDKRLHARRLTLAGAVATGAVGAPCAFAQCSIVEIRDPDSQPAFGARVATWGDIAAVGSLLHEIEGIDSGAAFVYRHDTATGGWNLETTLLAEDRQPGDYLGHVSAWGETIVVSAPGDDDLGANSGSAYVFRRVGGVWVQEQKLLADDGAAGDWFGGAVLWGGVTARDVVMFLDAWASGHPGADFHKDSQLDTRDIVSFLNAWASGC